MSLIIVGNQIVRAPIEALTGLGMVAASVPVYYLAVAGKTKTSGRLTTPSDEHD